MSSDGRPESGTQGEDVREKSKGEHMSRHARDKDNDVELNKGSEE